MVNIRRLNGEEMVEAANLANRIFRSDSDIPMEATHPLLFHPFNKTSYGCFVDKELIAFIGVVPQTIRIGSARMAALSLGAVCTKPEYRGRGYAGEMLRLIKKDAITMRIPLLLISGDGPLYKEHGSQYFGIRYSATVTKQSNFISEYNKRSNIVIEELSMEHIVAVQQLAQSRYCAYEQSIADIITLGLASNEQTSNEWRRKVYIAKDQHRTVAFLVMKYFKKQEDYYAGIVMEWGGSASDVANMVAKIVCEGKIISLEMPIMFHEQEMLKELRVTTENRLFNQGTIMITDYEKLLDDIYPYLFEKKMTAATTIELSTRYNNIQIAIGDTMLNMTEEQFASLMFNGVVTDDLDVNYDVTQQVREYFPLPFPYTAGLNYI